MTGTGHVSAEQPLRHAWRDTFADTCPDRVSVRTPTLAGMSTRTWVLVASRDHARRGLTGGFVMANHGKRAPVARMNVGDRVLIYSPTTSFPKGEPLRAITIVGEVTGEEPEPSAVIEGGFNRAARLREIEPIPLARVRDHLPTSRIRFGFFELPTEDAHAIWDLVDGGALAP